jgi:hypothetical protein
MASHIYKYTNKNALVFHPYGRSISTYTSVGDKFGRFFGRLALPSQSLKFTKYEVTKGEKDNFSHDQLQVQNI